MILMHTTLVGEEDGYREAPTWEWLRANGPELTAAGIDVHHCYVEPGEPDRYDALLRDHWAMDDLLLFERDMVPPDAASILRLRDCPELSCAIDYPIIRCNMVEVRTKQQITYRPDHQTTNRIVCAHHLGEYSMMRNYLGDWSDGTWPRCTCPPLGLTRLRKSLMARIPYPKNPVNWALLDLRVARLMSEVGETTHIHYPKATHNHPIPDRLCAHPPLPQFREVPKIRLADVKTDYQFAIFDAYNRTKQHWTVPTVTID